MRPLRFLLSVGLLASITTCSSPQDRYSQPICDGPHTDCHCPVSSWRICNDTCVDPKTDPRNCGGCGVSCGAQLCVNGVCADDCGELERCGAICRLPDDQLNCGGCGKQCQKGCVNNVCAEDVDCGLLSNCDGRCVDLKSDLKNCGQCGNDCLGKPYCNAGICSECPTGRDPCSGQCVDLQTDTYNCGYCGIICYSIDHRYCINGSCKLCDEKDGNKFCSGACVTMGTDQHCRDCDPCPPSTHCKYGFCQ
jgi:hypothetical protein